MRQPLKLKQKADYGLVLGAILQVSAILLFGIMYIQQNAKSSIVVAVHDIHKYDVIKQEDVSTMLVDAATAKMVGSINPVGKIATRDIPNGSFIFPYDVSENAVYLQKGLPEGSVATSIALKEEFIVGGRIEPGDVITLVGLYKIENSAQGVSKLCILESAPILDVVGERENNVVRSPIVIVPASLNTAKLISYISSEGKIFAFLEKRKNANFDANQLVKCEDIVLSQGTTEKGKV